MQRLKEKCKIDGNEFGLGLTILINRIFPCAGQQTEGKTSVSNCIARL